MPQAIPAAIGAGVGLAGAIGGAIQKGKVAKQQMKMANAINPIFNQYQTSEYAQKRLGMAQGMFNARMAGASDLERNIANTGANALANINRNASDSSQALAAAAGAQGQTNEALGNLQIAEKQNKYDLLRNLNEAYDTMTAEKSKEYQSMFDKYGMDVSQKNSLMGASWQNKAGMWNDIASGGMGFGELGTNMYKAGMFG